MARRWACGPTYICVIRSAKGMWADMCLRHSFDHIFVSFVRPFFFTTAPDKRLEFARRDFGGIAMRQRCWVVAFFGNFTYG